MKKSALVSQIQKELQQNAEPKNLVRYQRFFKEPVNFYGVGSASMKQLTSQVYKQMRLLDKADYLAICEELFASPYYEEQIIGAVMAEKIHRKYVPEDFDLFAGWIDSYVTNWAVCDTFCNHAVGRLIDLYPEKLRGLKNWALSPNRWMKRAAAVSLIIPAKEGRYLTDIFEIADLLLTDKEDMVQKGYGWMLKVASIPHQQEVLDYVMKHKGNMPRTALRYAIEKMPQELRQEAMRK